MSDRENYFKPQTVNDIFVEITKQSRCSGCEDDVRAYVISVVKDFNNNNPGREIEIVQYDEKATDPGQRVIVLRREAAPGMEGKPTVILQAHMDMVCVPDDLKFPIELTQYEEKLEVNGKEKTVNVLKGGGMTEDDGTTLGADDGIGLATALAIITDTQKAYGPIECLFTVQEETDMGGAQGFDISWLTGEKYVNLDSEDYNIITYGSAGGSGAVYQITPVSEAIPGEYRVVSITLDGLTGGHSGVNINEGNANAIKVLAQLLSRLRRAKKMDFNIVEFSGGSKTNAIPNSASVNIAFNSDKWGDFQHWCDEILGDIKKLYLDTDPGFVWSAPIITGSKKMMNTVSSHNLIDMLLDIPTGPLKMLSNPPDVVETSTNLAIVTADTGKITIRCSNRSSSDKSLACVEDMQKTIARLFGIEYTSTGNRDTLTIGDRYPAWDPNDDSQLLATAKDVYKEVYGQGNYEANVIHAGLECGWVVEKFKEAGRTIDCIAIGPTIKTPHTWNERLYTDTVEPFFRCVTGILDKIWG
ncbi:MAG: beta-Ala-His dipeptidase [Candidatus Aminicenantes bacterium]|nr:MAG: beta-Ala-His dipeptidase [Candidatus Aminicenantes bacterium]